MNNKPLQIFTAILGIADLIAFFFSFQLANKGIVSALSILAILVFSSIWFIEHLRNREVDNIKVETAPLSHTDIRMRDSGSRALMSTVEAKVEDWKKKQEQKIQETNEKYLDREKLVFGIGVVITIAIAYFLFFS